MRNALLLLGAMAAIVGVWVVVRLVRAARLSRRGFGVDSEDRRLRHDPRFTEIWVQQFRPEPPPDGTQKPPPAPPG